jgi:hypothetical protein
MKTIIRHRVFAAAAWVIFIVSFFLPAFDQMPGWKAAILPAFFWRQAMQGDLLAIHLLLLTIANLLMIVSPFFIAWGARDVRFVNWLRGLSVGATVLVWLFLVRLIAAHNGADLRFGCYLWAASFVLICLASMLQQKPLKGEG